MALTSFLGFLVSPKILGFSHVFCAESSLSEVYDKMVNPLVDDFLKGKSGMVAAMGPSGCSKTHTVFGSARDRGMVLLAVRQIFSEKEINGSKCSRARKRGKDNGFIRRRRRFIHATIEYQRSQRSSVTIHLHIIITFVTFLQVILNKLGFLRLYQFVPYTQTIIHDVQHAESLFASGMLKRSTAMTNSNIQSSRSQCIINIRSDFENIDFHLYFHTGFQSYTALLTIVDLAGVERENKTGNQGARFLESNFINNTSMVFGLCLRLTKYLRDFLEGKKRMALILTAKSSEEDYQDTPYMLRQASPFMNIKYEHSKSSNFDLPPLLGIISISLSVTSSASSKAKSLSSSEFIFREHGIKQPRTGWADGPAYVTRCPIRPGNVEIGNGYGVPGGGAYYTTGSNGNEKQDSNQSISKQNKQTPNNNTNDLPEYLKQKLKARGILKDESDNKLKNQSPELMAPSTLPPGWVSLTSGLL
ncbi:hypothetical protein L2E82_26949 [Cichorium intybus]|uniref:Uncharacterized protein n=1 Tax=Cichorium intybus TaxID=13427 RepID=A0ACB9CRL8_CICIN|nr:hypothetical protein L2E82_26949 [Cichorium intybus]